MSGSQVAADIFQALCKFYSADHRIMQSGILKSLPLRIDKKYLQPSDPTFFCQFCNELLQSSHYYDTQTTP